MSRSKQIENAERDREPEIELLDPILSEQDHLAVRERSVEKLRLLWNHRRFLARTAAVGLLAATIVAFLAPKRFTSTAHLMPPDQGPGMAGMAMMAALAGKASSTLGSVGSELLGLKTSGDLFIGILQSRSVEDDLVAKFDLRKRYRVKRWDDARRELTRRTDVSQDKRSEIIAISVEDRDPGRAQQMTQEYINQLNTVVTKLNTTSAHRERVFLEERLSQVQKDLESAETNFSQFASKNTTIDMEAQGKAMIAAGANLEGQLIASETELQGLRQIFTDNNVRVRETQARVDELERQLGKLGGKAGAAGASTGQADGTLYPPIRQLPVLGVAYTDLYRRMKVQEAVFETLTQQYELAKVEEAKETPSVKVLDPPELPEKKSFPPRPLIIFLGTMLAFTFGISCVLGRQAWEATDATDVRKVFASQVWADVRAGLPWASVNGRNGAQALAHHQPLLDSAANNGSAKQSHLSGDLSDNGADQERVQSV